MINKKIGLSITGSFCTFKRILPIIKELVDNGNDVYPILSYNVSNMDTRFYKAEDFKTDLINITKNTPIETIPLAEPIGPTKGLDIMIIAPCSGNTLAKLNHAITDTPVLMAAKAHLRNNKPLLIAVSTNDAMSNNLKNIGEMLNKKHIYFVPFKQDDPIEKPNSIVAEYEMITKAADLALEGKQIQPVLRG